MTETPLTQRALISSLKAVKWEEAKGALRALVALDGAREGGSEDDDGLLRYQIISVEIEAFIKNFESQGLHE